MADEEKRPSGGAFGGMMGSKGKVCDCGCGCGWTGGRRLFRVIIVIVLILTAFWVGVHSGERRGIYGGGYGGWHGGYYQMMGGYPMMGGGYYGGTAPVRMMYNTVGAPVTPVQTQ